MTPRAISAVVFSTLAAGSCCPATALGKNLLTGGPDAEYDALAAPHWAVGRGNPESIGAQPPASGFFVRAVQLCAPLWRSWAGQPFGWPVPIAGISTPAQFCLPSVERGEVDLIHTIGAPIMATPARIPSALPGFIARAAFAVPSTEVDSDFTPSVTVELGRFASQHQADAARHAALTHPAAIAASVRREVCHE